MALRLVCIGDSLCSGRVTNNQPFTASGHTGRMWKSGSWQTIADPTCNAESANGSYWPKVASLLCADGYDVDLLNHGIGSSGLRFGSSLWTKAAGTNYAAMQSAISAASMTPDAFLVLLGANDATDTSTFTTATYRTAVNQLVSDLRADYANVPILWHQLGEVTTGSPADRRVELDAVREGIRSSNAKVAGAAYDTASDDGVHYKTDGHADLMATRIYLGIVQHVLGGGAYTGTGPTIASAVKTAPTSIVVTYDAATNLTPASGIQGYRVIDNGSVATIASVTGTGKTNTITLSGALTGPTTVSLGSANDGSGATVPRDMSANSLPALAFADVTVTVPGGYSVFSGMVR